MTTPIVTELRRHGQVFIHLPRPTQQPPPSPLAPTGR
jgi:hypothetical protein